MRRRIGRDHLDRNLAFREASHDVKSHRVGAAEVFGALVANKMEAAQRGNSDAERVALESGTIEKPTTAAKTQADRVIETSKGQ